MISFIFHNLPLPYYFRLMFARAHKIGDPVMLWSCITLLFGSMFVADLFQSFNLKLVHSPSHLPHVIRVHIYMLRLLE
jgi:hypothetical protein